ncbi:MarR family transcriptional regulator [Leuconostoc litchii]|uniref:MarR family transcriptional regulator n=1 Tax=Leuconostoc litchii TaxID=1981069 RepID=A0A6P2CPM2_9LACO|nr:MarR family transcriptional regulator [Leuconostoc litchii]TYC47062.1 MarR family transcriptional regulator [Leuconostoc litchii]GMA68996.1 MarR family transcriptional regulator [Leuconostoc litchii]
MKSIGKLFKIGQRNLNKYLDMLAQVHGVTGSQLLAIKFIASNECVTQKDIEQEFHIKASSVATMIDRMVEKNIVIRIPRLSDKRVNEIHLTKAGEKINGIARNAIQMHDEVILQPFSAEERKTIIKFLEYVADDKINK